MVDDAAPASIANIAFDTGRIAERKRIQDLILELQADVPIDGEAYEALDQVLDLINTNTTMSRRDLNQ